MIFVRIRFESGYLLAYPCNPKVCGNRCQQRTTKSSAVKVPFSASSSRAHVRIFSGTVASSDIFFVAVIILKWPRPQEMARVLQVPWPEPQTPLLAIGVPSHRRKYSHFLGTRCLTLSSPMLRRTSPD